MYVANNSGGDGCDGRVVGVVVIVVMAEVVGVVVIVVMVGG